MPFNASWWEVIWAVVAGLFWFGIMVLVVVVAVAALRGRTRGRGGGSAVRLLEERYARGEIAREEFLERRRVLLSDSPSGSS